MSSAPREVQRAPRRYALPAHLYLCEFPNGAVLLDLMTNRYTGLKAQDAAELRVIIGCEVDCTSNATHLSRAGRWLDKGLLITTETGTQPFAAAGAGLRDPISDLEIPSRGAALRASDLTSFLWACASSRFALRHQSLWTIACNLRARRERARVNPHASNSALSLAVARFRRLRPLTFAAHDQCLFHALALARFLTANRLPTIWVIGVRLNPWGAHSWVQHGALTLDATPESVHDFHPIIAV